MKKKWIIDNIALENKGLIEKGRLFRRIGLYGVCCSLLCITIGEFITDTSSLKIMACNNEAADLIGELGCIYVEQTKK